VVKHGPATCGFCSLTRARPGMRAASALSAGHD
jgi:hypothetical protein